MIIYLTFASFQHVIAPSKLWGGGGISLNRGELVIDMLTKY